MSQTKAATMTTFVILTTMLMVATVVSGQAMPPMIGGEVCGANLFVCAAALREVGGGGKLAKECCDGLETAVKTQLSCLCGVLMDPQVLAGFNLTVETALLIPTSCGLDVGPSTCAANGPLAHGAAPVPANAPLPHVAAPVAAPVTAPVAAPVPGTLESDKAAAAKLAGTGLVGFILTAISMMF